MNNTRDKREINCIYGLNNKQLNGYIKIGSTNNPEKRKWDYQTSSHLNMNICGLIMSNILSIFIIYIWHNY